MQRGKFFTTLLVFITLLGFVGFTTSSFGATIYVPGDYSTIQDALNAAVNHDTIVVAAGTYRENITFSGKAVALRGAAGAALTIIDGAQNGSVVTFDSSEGADTVLDGFTITNGRGADGGGIYCHFASPTITNVTIANNDADSGKGGGLFLKHSGALVEGCEISSNTAIFGGGGICCNRSTATFRNNRVHGNSCGNSSGGGFYFYYSNDVIENNVIDENTAGYSGGGIYATFSDPSVTGNRIEKNDASFGGGMSCEDSSPTIIQNTIRENTASVGGGVDCYDSSPVIDNNIIARNSAGGSAGIYCGGSSAALITRNVIKENIATASGGGINCGSNTVIASNMIYRNEAGNVGGGVYCHSGSPSIVSNTITENRADVSGGGIGCWNAAASVTNTIVWNNAAGDSAEIHVGNATYPSSLQIDHSDVMGGQASIVVEPSCTLDWGPGMIEAEPGFAHPAADDYHLKFNSPCIDSGDSVAQNIPADDFEGDRRSFLDSADIGADEFYFHLYCVGEVIPGRTAAIRVVGGPNMPVIVALGSGVQSPPLQTAYGEFHLVLPVLKSFRGRIPADGILTLDAPVPTAWTSGDSHPLQALVGGKGWPYTTLTNVMHLAVD